MNYSSLEEKLERVDDHIIGIWKFKRRGMSPKWCATYCWEGEYYDIEGKPTVEEVLDCLYRELVLLQHGEEVTLSV
ncbi:hypothetical protein MY04_0807 [Flammeovirga sp. MY04]|uniref:hypothetical protein n=1 Tax=Flammeovirga sp. MY04 TaxID=1191459 RepID=UPI0008061D2D|nr:hypothetical protein [Flammeovirga sp. MY04]ANQ48189.1 hypothetical protein MY04_0807 [Flammeovirga sp. MY04]